jgi:hypothetical protein
VPQGNGLGGVGAATQINISISNVHNHVTNNVTNVTNNINTNNISTNNNINVIQGGNGASGSNTSGTLGANIGTNNPPTIKMRDYLTLLESKDDESSQMTQTERMENATGGSVGTGEVGTLGGRAALGGASVKSGAFGFLKKVRGKFTTS